jgi:hypothetical protein
VKLSEKPSEKPSEKLSEKPSEKPSPKLSPESLQKPLQSAAIEALLEVELYNSKFFNKAHSDDEAILENSRISSTMLKSNSASTSEVEDNFKGKVN